MIVSTLRAHVSPIAVNPMKNLYRRLGQVGLPKRFVVETALPSWWDDEIALNPAGYAQRILLLSRHLGLDLATLQSESAPLRLREFGTCKYKKRDSVSEDDLAICRTLATRAAQLAAEAMERTPGVLPDSAADIRQAVLDAGAAGVGLPELVDYCWDSGIPVLHLDHFPKTAHRPDGFAARVNGRPVIILCVRKKQPAWLLFILAHELAHLALGHIPDNGALIDDKIERDSIDTEERDANAFALELLCGSPPKQFRASGAWPDAAQLAVAARQIGRDERIDPGHIVLHYAHSMGSTFYPVAQAALARLDPGADAIGDIRTKMADSLDWSKLPEDSSEFLMRIMRRDAPDDALNSSPA